MRKKEEREAAEALKREQELREAKRQEQRLNFLIQQTELYSHFMKNKSSSQPSEDLPGRGGKQKDEDASQDSSDDETIVEEDPEEAELRKEALKAAQDAVSKQKKLISDFDENYMKEAGAEPEGAQEVAGASSIDLHNPSVPLSFIFLVLSFFWIVPGNWSKVFLVKLIKFPLSRMQFHHACNINCSDTRVV